MSTTPAAIITGAARGMGHATASRFSWTGWVAAWRVAMVDRHDAGLARWGQIDARVNHAGVAGFGPIMATGIGLPTPRQPTEKQEG